MIDVELFSLRPNVEQLGYCFRSDVLCVNKGETVSTAERSCSTLELRPMGM
ncbi:MAG: hypothetical protein IPN77_22400 [Sandaracinaceae bacterium]|nr:hypothetical protein [Sandaracinaceae bacterium]